MRLIIGIVVLPSLVVGSFWILDRNGFFAVDKIETVLEDSGQRVDHLKAQVAALNDFMEKTRGQSLWALKLENLSQEISKLSWVESSHLVRVWPSTLRLKIHPHVVYLVYKSERGELFPMIKDGTFLDSVSAAAVPDVAVLSGEVFSRKPNLRKQAADLIQKIPQTGSFSRKTISEIGYDSKDGFWMSLMKSGLQIKMGENDIPLKSARVSQVVDYLDTHKFDARVIDANLSQKVLVRLRKDP